MAEVKRLTSAYPLYSVKTTGHSLGAALATLTQMDLIKNGYSAVNYNFGQPRVGDASFSSFATSKTLGSFRVTHNKDTVPHVPFTNLGFTHHCFEEFENSSGATKTCDSSCEDTTCADQYSSFQ